MYFVQDVKVFDVNSYEVCAVGEKELEEYLVDVLESHILNKDYKREASIILTEQEYGSGFTCKELRHMKINRLFQNRDEAGIYGEILQMKHLVNQ